MTREKISRKPMNVEQTLTAFKWCESHKDELATVSRKEAVARCFADTGVHIPILRLAEIEEKMGIDRRYGGDTLPKKERNIIASELVRLMESLGLAPDPKLKAMAGG